MPETERLKSLAKLFCACLILAAIPNKSLAFENDSQNVGSSSAVGVSPSYADIADHATVAPLVIKTQARKMILVDNNRAGTPPAGHVRALVTAKVLALIRGEGGIPPQISYLVDLPAGKNGKPAKLGKAPYIVFARPGGRADFIQLVSRKAQMPWSAALESRVRGVVGEVLRADAPPRVVGLGDAFHISGTVEGEGETQIFLKTANGAPVSLSVIRRPSQAPRWGVSLGEVVDEAAAAPKRDTLLWYMLACALPPVLPSESVRTLPVKDAEAAQRDYRFVLEGLGTCGRTL